MIKVCDVGHTTKALPNTIEWTIRVNSEFFLQGDREKMLGIPVSPFMDRLEKNIPKNQLGTSVCCHMSCLGFIDYIVKPMLEAYEKVSGDPTPRYSLETNREHYVALLQQDIRDIVDDRGKVILMK